MLHKIGYLCSLIPIFFSKQLKQRCQLFNKDQTDRLGQTLQTSAEMAIYLCFICIQIQTYGGLKMGADIAINSHEKTIPRIPQVTTQHETLISITQNSSIYQQFAQLASKAKKHSSFTTVPSLTFQMSPHSIRIATSLQQKVSTWKQLFAHSMFLKYFVSFLGLSDRMAVKNCNRELRRAVVVDILKQPSNWELTMLVLQPHISRDVCLRESKVQEEYEHSEDLDRTNGYFEVENEEDLVKSKMKLDRVVTTVSFQVRYFQGVMPIVATLLQCFDEQTCYWVLKYLLFRSSYIQTNMEVYSQFMVHLEAEFQSLEPEIYGHLETMGFELSYFVMKWVMGLFAEDLPKSMLLSVWDILLQTEVHYLVYLTISLFGEFRQELLASNGDEINQLLKWQLKQRCEEIDQEGLLTASKQMYILHRLKL